MKVVKPDKLSVLQRVFEHEDRCHFVLTLLVGFSFDRPRALMSEVDLWKMAGDELLDEGGALDEAQLKVRGEVLVTGKCFAPRGEPVTVWPVRVQIANVDKRLAVIGDRYWKHGVPTEPEPFVEMPVDWTHAFGGEGFDKNPRGKGFKPITIDDEKVHPLPNIEHPKRLITSPGDRPEPAGFGTVDFSWPQRQKKAGTYDTHWLETRYPGYAADMDFTIFNAAPEDQYLAEYFHGGEPFVIENMHPERKRIEGRLPDVVTRAFVTQQEPSGEEVFREIAMRLDTVRFIPHRLSGVLSFRGVLPIHEDDALDILHLVTACEQEGVPRSVDHYRHALELRLDKEKGAMMALKNEDLMPDAVEGWEPRPEKVDVQNWVQSEGYAERIMERRLQLEWEAAKGRLEAMGLDPADFGIAEPPQMPKAPDPENIDETQAYADKLTAEVEERRKQAAIDRAKLEESVKERYRERGEDYDAAVEKAIKANAGPPTFDAEKQFAWLASLLETVRMGGGEAPPELERIVEDEKMLAEFKKLERMARDGYRVRAHVQMPVDPVPEASSELFRAELEAAHFNDIALEDVNYCGADLSNLQLAGVVLVGAFLEAVNLTSANLAGADLTNAVLAHALFRNTDLHGANLSGANLGSATFEGADLSGCRMVGTVLQRAKLRSVNLSGAHLESVALIETEIGAVDLRKVVARTLQALSLDMRQVDCREADLYKAVFYDVDLRGVRFDGANLSEASFLQCQLDDACFAQATMEKTVLVYGTTAERADFRGANLTSALLRGVKLGGAKLDHAVLDKANISGADFTEASLYQARAREAMAIRTNFSRAQMTSCDLLGAMLSKAKLNGANLLGANLFGADLARIRFDADTNFDEAELGRARQIPRQKDGPK